MLSKRTPATQYFKKHTLKLSYSGMPNMRSIISSHNKAPQTKKNAIAGKKINARWTENALHKM